MGFFDTLFRRKPTQDQFAKLFVEAARRQGFEGDLSYKADEFRLLLGEGSFFNLHNAYHAYCNTQGAQQKRALQGFVSALASSKQLTPQQASVARPMLRAVIRSRTALEDVRLHHVRTEGNDAAFHPAYLPFGDDCVVLLALDHPDAISTLTNGPEAAWQLTFEQALAIAIDNLRDTPDDFAEISPGVHRGAWADGYDISRALLPDMIERVPVRGRPVFMMPTRDVLLVTGDNDDEGLSNMVELSLQALMQGRSVSAHMYHFNDRQPQRYEPTDPVLAQRLAHLARLLDKSEYDAQKAVLDHIHEEQGHDIFVANYNLFTTDEEPAMSFSLASWTRGVDTSLPKVDRLALVRPDAQDDIGEVRVVSWDQAAHLLEPLLAREPGYPVRYRTRGFPDDAQLAQLTEVP
ncbi:hypothetical protein [Achromobacter piechaudii]|uniref:DUF1444 family protein n=1 Tax=Achromobacter piechaudii TaxID=72556 RepID=A0ABM8KWT8_9BURK|nr:hypothetical protein [Achromobacter piechaudii]CAB3696668.1 hypothetical protein LMG1873_02411 [Achromobacter piechaudii]CAB3855987.1 hypothetical protein LMG2828_02210 [Achromobacter piechaudii]CAB3950263.1 hypothetical protein LMG6103_02530 [Achromobacter piechaudii]